jgi:hypothetical protein
MQNIDIKSTEIYQTYLIYLTISQIPNKREEINYFQLFGCGFPKKTP